MEKKIYRSKSIIRSMNKRGEIVTVVAVISFIIMASSIVAGTFFLTQENFQPSSDNKYVGDIEEKQFYDITCVNKISEGSRVFFKTFVQAEKLEFQYISECPK